MRARSDRSEGRLRPTGAPRLRQVLGLWLLGAGCGAGVASVGRDREPPSDPATVEAPATSTPTIPVPTTSSPTTPPTEPVCSGLPGASGTFDRVATVGGSERHYRVHVPPGLDPDAPTPLVLVFHGYTMSGAVMDRVTTWSDLGDREGFVVVFPDGADDLVGGPWNVGSGVCGAGALVNSPEDDFGYVVDMVEDVATVQCLDRERVFATGFSMGAYFSHHLGCAGPGPVRAIAPHSGGTYDGDCANGPLPVLVLHGDADVIIDPACGEDAVATWLERDGCPAVPPTAWDVEGGQCERVDGCADGTSVQYCTFFGMDHGWAGSDDLLYGGGDGYEDAAELIWAFFASW